MKPTSGPLSFETAKGLHRVTAQWWIGLGSYGEFFGRAFELKDAIGRRLAALTNLAKLRVFPGYQWDGSSGPTLDGKADPVPSLVHDVLYEALRARKLPRNLRGVADSIYYDLLRERGMSRTRAGARWLGLRLCGWVAARPGRSEYSSRSAL